MISYLWETRMLHQKNTGVVEEADYSQFPFVFHYTHMLVFFHTDAIEINWKSTPKKRKSSRVLSEKNQQVINNTGQIMVTCSTTTCRNRSYFILTIKTVTFAKKKNKTERPKLAKLPKHPKKKNAKRKKQPKQNH